MFYFNQLEKYIVKNKTLSNEIDNNEIQAINKIQEVKTIFF